MGRRYEEIRRHLHTGRLVPRAGSDGKPNVLVARISSSKHE